MDSKTLNAKSFQVKSVNRLITQILVGFSGYGTTPPPFTDFSTEKIFQRAEWFLLPKNTCFLVQNNLGVSPPLTLRIRFSAKKEFQEMLAYLKRYHLIIFNTCLSLCIQVSIRVASEKASSDSDPSDRQCCMGKFWQVKRKTCGCVGVVPRPHLQASLSIDQEG